MRVYHGMSDSREYSSFRSMMSRCYNPNFTQYSDYGGRGIRVCERWFGHFEKFYEDMGPRPVGTTLDRKDNNGNYTPENCHWGTHHDQTRNSRRNRWLTLRGETKTLKDWANELGFKSNSLASRLDRGWDTYKALTFPPLNRGRRTWNTH